VKEAIWYRDIGLDTHILDIIQLLEYENLSEVRLFGHSYGGLVIGGAAEKVSERIRRLVYLDAYIPQDNKSAVDTIPRLETIYKESPTSTHVPSRYRCHNKQNEGLR
jgi:pimeloyl-ACP methyl ester carboxylesterase